MSGGSYNYAAVEIELWGAEGALKVREHLEQMALDMTEDGYPTAAHIPRSILSALDVLEVYLRSLHESGALKVLHGFEWWKSCDWDEKGFQRVLLEYLDGLDEVDEEDVEVDDD